MKSLGVLRVQATRSAHNRKHEQVTWQAPHHGEHRSYQIGTCDDCGLDVCINTLPQPNEIDIGGELVALNCQR